MLKEDLEKVLDEYLDAKKKSNKTSEPIAHYITKDIRNNFSKILGSNKFVINSSAGRGSLADIPWIDIGLTTRDFDNINIAYFFRSDMSGVYLVLRTFFFGDLEKKYGNYLPDYIKTKKIHIRNFIKNSKFDIENFSESIDLISKRNTAKKHEEGVILSKFYKKGEIPQDDELIKDLKELIEINKYVADNYVENMYLTSDEWVQSLENDELISDKMLSILEIMYKLPDYTASTYQIIDIRKQQGFEGEKSYNSDIVANSKRVKNFYKKDELYDSKDNETFWPRLFYGNKTKDAFYFILRDELIEALGKYDKSKRDIEEVEIMEKKEDSFHEYLLNKGYLFEKETIENYLLSLKVKPFVILTGNSGTGKTKLSQLFAQYLSENNENYRIIPVGANWTENRHIIGYYNILTNEHKKTPAFELIDESQKNTKPYFLILDEMNLSHVERYFADFLSAIESNEPIPVEGREDLEIPENLFIIDTVNVDETTYMFSPKVLDRANTIEFKTHSAKDYMTNTINTNAPSGNIDYLENLLKDSQVKYMDINQLKQEFRNVTYNNHDFWEVLSDEIFKFQEILKKSGFDFGFRVINEITRFMLVSWKYENSPQNWDNWQRYFDTQIKQKMLPKLHGSQKVIGQTLDELSKECEQYTTSKIKLEEMRDVLSKQRYVSYIN